MDIGVDAVIRETYLSSIDIAGKVLGGLGLSEADVQHTLEKFTTYDEKLLVVQHAVHKDETQLVEASKQAAKELESLFEADAAAPASSEGQPPQGAAASGGAT
jgi:glutathione-regulated potassium-efflux system ancillary protein KefC/glutathione-regulated potassium-efflux system protein KefB